MLTRDQILNAPDLKTEPVEVPEWGGTLHVRVMTGAERLQYEKRAKKEGADLAVPLMVAMTACTPEGTLLFTEDDVRALAGKSMTGLWRVRQAAFRLNKLDVDDVEAAEGESEATRSST